MSSDTDARLSPTLTLDEVAAHFEDWRRQKRRGERIPDRLWSEAIALVERDGVSSVARRLRLSGRDLNRRRGIVGRGRRRRAADVPATFVELGPEPMTPALPRARLAAGCLELIRPDGLRLRIEPGAGLDPRSVLERFLEAR